MHEGILEGIAFRANLLSQHTSKIIPYGCHRAVFFTKNNDHIIECLPRHHFSFA